MTDKVGERIELFYGLVYIASASRRACVITERDDVIRHFSHVKDDL